MAADITGTAGNKDWWQHEAITAQAYDRRNNGGNVLLFHAHPPIHVDLHGRGSLPHRSRFGITPAAVRSGLHRPPGNKEPALMRIAMIGTGYVGLVSGACFSEFGVSVTCVDNDAGKIERLRQGEIPIYEPGLDQLVASNVAAGRLNFTTELTAAVTEADAVFIAVGTPSRRGDGHADLSYVFAAAAEIAEALATGPAQRPTQRTVIVTKS